MYRSILGFHCCYYLILAFQKRSIRNTNCPTQYKGNGVFWSVSFLALLQFRLVSYVSWKSQVLSRKTRGPARRWKFWHAWVCHWCMTGSETRSMLNDVWQNEMTKGQVLSVLSHLKPCVWLALCTIYLLYRYSGIPCNGWHFDDAQLGSENIETFTKVSVCRNFCDKCRCVSFCDLATKEKLKRQ